MLDRSRLSKVGRYNRMASLTTDGGSLQGGKNHNRHPRRVGGDAGIWDWYSGRASRIRNSSGAQYCAIAIEFIEDAASASDDRGQGIFVDPNR
jgi:hypothetical protein